MSDKEPVFAREFLNTLKTQLKVNTTDDNEEFNNAMISLIDIVYKKVPEDAILEDRLLETLDKMAKVMKEGEENAITH